MQLKIFHIRLEKEHFQSDQDKLNHFLNDVYVKKTEAQLITDQPNFWSILVFYDDKKVENQSGRVAVIDESELTADEKIIYEILKKWRRNKADELQVPNYVICHNTELMSVTRANPKSLNDFFKIKGWGDGQKTAKYGEEIISVLSSSCLEEIKNNAYEPWSKEDDNELELLFCQGKSIKEIAQIFERKEGAITSRIKKLELREKYNSENQTKHTELKDNMWEEITE